MKLVLPSIPSLIFLMMGLNGFIAQEVRGQDADPYIVSIELVNTVDRDNDGSYESWSFQIDVDPYYMDHTAPDVYIEIFEPNFHSGNGDVYGPYDFTNYNENDAVTLGPYSTDGISGLPAELEFLITVSNYLGTDDRYFGVQAEYLANEAPRVVSVDVVNTTDSDYDNWYESFSFEFDIDPEMGGVSDEVYIDLDADYGDLTQTFGPFSFVGNTDQDKVLIGPFSENQFDATPRLIPFEFTVRNSVGNDYWDRDMEVDGDDYGPLIDQIYVRNQVDQDQDQYLESWYVEVDMEEIGGGDLEAASVELRYNGSALYALGPVDFLAGSTADNVTFGPFSYTDFSQGRGSYTFTIWAENFYGSVTRDFQVQVDDQVEQSVAPDLVSLQVTRTVDQNQDGSYEEFYLALDVDPLNGTLSRDVYIDVNADQGAWEQTYGPYRVEDHHSSGQYEIGPFTDDFFNNLPRNITVSVEVYNNQGSDQGSVQVPVDDGSPQGSAPVASFSADQTSGLAPLQVQFTDQSLNEPTSWLWEFPGGSPSSSTSQNPQVTYSSPGSYAVQLTATNAFGSNTATLAGFITVNEAVQSTDASLAVLTFSQGILQPAFAPTVFEYQLLLPSGTQSAPSISAQANSSGATLDITPPLDILSQQEVDRTAVVLVTAENVSVQQTYRIVMNVEQSELHQMTFTSLTQDNLNAFAGNDSLVEAGTDFQLGSDSMATGGVPPYSYAWFDPDNNPLNGERPVVQPVSTGDYTLFVTDAQGCTSVDKVSLQVGTTGVSEMEDGQAIRIYPQPASDYLILEFSRDPLESVRLSLYDLRSALVYQEEVFVTGRSHRLNLENLPSGIYILHMEQESMRVSKRVLIQNN